MEIIYDIAPSTDHLSDIDAIIQGLISSKMMKIELHPVGESLGTLNLNSIESWRKLDIDGFFEMYAFLIDK